MGDPAMPCQFHSLIIMIGLLFTACQKPPKMAKTRSEANPGDTILPGVPPQVSTESFRLNVYEPILQPYCQSCHATTFVDSELEVAHGNFLPRVAFDKFTGVDQTPVVQKLRQAHNCWEGETQKCVTAMADAISLWLLDLEAAGFKPTPPSYPYKTPSIALATAIPTTVAIDGTQYAGAGVDTASVAEPFTTGADDIDGALKTYAMGRAGTAPIANVNQAQAGQAVTFNVDVKTAGTYQIWARVKTPSAQSNGFFARINNANVAFNTPVTDAVWKWVRLTRVQNNNEQPITLQVAAPAVVPVPILFRAPEAKINYIALTQKTDEFDGEQFANQFLDIAIDLPIPGAKIIATVWEKTVEEGKRSLGVRELRIESPKPIRIKTIYPLINGLFHANHGTYTLVDTVAGGSAEREKQVISTGGSTATTWLADITKDEISFAFEVLEEVP
jgi:hypothetical protein